MIIGGVLMLGNGAKWNGYDPEYRKGLHVLGRAAELVPLLTTYLHRAGLEAPDA